MSGKEKFTSQSNKSCKIIQDLRKYSKEELYNFLISFDTILSDCDGVVWNCHTPIKDALPTLKQLQDMGKRVFFVSNNSTQPMDFFLNKLKTLGFPAKKEQIIIPALVVSWYLNYIGFKGDAYVIGTEPFKNVLRENGIAIAQADPDVVKEDLADVIEALEDVPTIKAIIHDFDPNYSWMKIMRSIISLRRKDCLYIAAALDTKVAIGTEYPLLGTKYFTDLVNETSGREPILTGKPSELLKQYVFKICDITNPERCLFIGDTLEQDMGFARLCGFKKLIVSSGVTSFEDVLKEEVARPDLYIPSLGELLPMIEKINLTNNIYDRSSE